VVGPEEVAAVVREVKGGRVDFKIEKAGVLHVPVGKSRMAPEQIRDNFLALFQAVLRAKPATAKGQYVRGVTLSSTMGPGIRLDVNDLVRTADAM
jgi:large subunit ribosomal protein L1